MKSGKTARLCSMGVLIWCAMADLDVWATDDKSLSHPLSVEKTPGQNFDLGHYKLQLPVAGHRGVEEISGLGSYQSKYFYTDPSSGAMVFSCPDNGATTKGTHYPRTELRSLENWTFTGNHQLTATLAVIQQTGSRDIIIGQIHGDGKGSEALKLRWHDGQIIAGVKTNPGTSEARQTIVSGIALGEKFTYTIAQQGHNVTVTVNGSRQTFVYGAGWRGETVYFKAGNYLQDNSASGSSGIVAFYGLQ